ncbi:MAG: hypothetical protein Q8L48_38930 [Archangium sp.]|nr:hypothetical protein [Archangium sp.]
MRTSALLTALLASAAAAQDSRFEVNVPVEVTLVGLTFGVRPELLFRPGEPGSVSRLRLAFGVLGGPDHLFLPLSLGYRAQFRQAHVVQPAVGLGLELQHRLVNDLAPVRQFGAYLEGGVGFAVSPRVSVSVMLGLDLMLFGGPGFGFGPRLAAGWRF